MIYFSPARCPMCDQKDTELVYVTSHMLSANLLHKCHACQQYWLLVVQGNAGFYIGSDIPLNFLHVQSAGWLMRDLYEVLISQIPREFEIQPFTEGGLPPKRKDAA